MKNKLISMVDFVLIRNHRGNGNYTVGDEVISFHSVLKYANFLNTPLNLSMFVPCVKVGDKWEVLEEPICYGIGDEQYFGCRMDEYQKAKENVIFEGFDSVELVNDNIILTKRNLKDSFHISCTIEMLLDVFFLTLTEQGMIKSGLK